MTEVFGNFNSKINALFNSQGDNTIRKNTLPDIVDNGDGSVTIKYQPQETGLHNLHVAYNNKPIEGMLIVLLVYAFLACMSDLCRHVTKSKFLKYFGTEFNW